MPTEGIEGGREAVSSAEQGRAADSVDQLAHIRADGRAAAKAVGRSGPLRVDAQRNLRLVLSAARDVFGEQGYGAPMEEIARRARVGVGTVYRRFPNKEALVRHIAEEETQRLTDSAREALRSPQDEPWGALEGFVRRSAAAGTGRLLPPELLAASTLGAEAGERAAGAMGAAAESVDGGEGDGNGNGEGNGDGAAARERVPRQRDAREQESREQESRELLAAVGQLVERTRAAGQLRADVTVADVMLVIATTPPRLEDPARRRAAGRRLLHILLQGLRAPGDG